MGGGGGGGGGGVGGESNNGPLYTNRLGPTSALNATPVHRPSSHFVS